ncbi:hypothetical protein [Qipengyuania sp.]|uniref:CC_3452 family protein n=1 Tax=Qipengyuania sp. TaxID=2004515 RepID=UPI0035C812B8
MPSSNTIPARIGALGAAIIWSATSLSFLVSPAPARAQDPGTSYYSASLVEPVAEKQLVVGGLVWRCAETACVAAKGTSRALRVCRTLNRKSGEVSRFVTAGSVMSSEELARCNA